MKLQESIRRILREENSLLPMIRRRVPQGVLDKEFSESLESASSMFLYVNEKYDDTMALIRFINVVVSMMIDGIHYELHSTTPGDSKWYDDVYNSLKGYYKDKIEMKHNQLMRKVLKEEYEIPINVRRRLHTLRDTLKDSLLSSYPCDYDGLDEFIEGIIWDVNEYFRWVEKEKKMTSEQAELTIRAYLLDDIKEYYLEETQNC